MHVSMYKLYSILNKLDVNALYQNVITYTLFNKNQCIMMVLRCVEPLTYFVLEAADTRKYEILN